MSALKKIIWGLVSLLGAGALAVVTGLFRPQEKVNALWLIVAAACLFAITYRFYASWMVAKVLALDDKRTTPAVRLNDGMDFHPTNRWVLFGHHFAAIAGAGPLIGPMLAAQFGYLPGFLWILVGSALAGAVHDMVILAASVKRDGQSLAQIAKAEIGPVGGLAASLAIIFIIIVALAGLGLAVVNALTASPWGTFTLAATIPIALFMGVYLKILRPGKVGEVTLLGVVLLLAAIIGGHGVPGSWLEPYFNLTRNQLIGALALYGFSAAILPVWLLLAPRDYLSTYMKVGTILLLAVGVVILAPDLQMPAVTRFVGGGGPVIPGTLFPFMFITIACGAISGFHALISSGTTPKMLMNEKEIKFIGFGAMLTEGFVAMMALIAATVLIPGDYLAINSKLTFDQLAALGFPVHRIQELCTLVGLNVVGRPGGAVSLAVGMASILGGLPGLKGLMPYWYNFAIMFEALFILTTVDAGTRVARFLVQEMGSVVFKPLAQRSWLPGVLGASMLVVAAWAFLIYSGSVATIWPMFGVTNQLLAAIALGIASVIMLKEGKARYVWVTALPMAFMFITTLTAAWQLWNAKKSKMSSARYRSALLTWKTCWPILRKSWG
ncbi:MAG: carbon starvation protein A [Candidatus Firestonebacteria bacterium]|nr:carbon starvation protein A [Candidatus Firestonebacteria bacterium]